MFIINHTIPLELGFKVEDASAVDEAIKRAIVNLTKCHLDSKINKQKPNKPWYRKERW